MLASTINEINQEIFRCRYTSECDTLGGKRYGMFYISPSFGYFPETFDSDQDIFFVAQNPGLPVKGKKADEAQYSLNVSFDVKSKMYFEAIISNKHIQNILHVFECKPGHFIWTNVVKCPTRNNNYPSQKAINICSTYLRRQVDIIDPKKIVAIGSLACRFFAVEFGQIKRTLEGALICGLPHYSSAREDEYDLYLERFRRTLIYDCFDI